jgi:hypothetical protein
MYLDDLVKIAQLLLREKYVDSLDWFKGKSTGNHGFYHQI